MVDPGRIGLDETLANGELPAACDEVASPSWSAARRLANRYEILGLVGSGGMGAVYRVRDAELGEVVALKMLRPEWTSQPQALERFRQEVRLARRVTHRNVARTFDIGEHEGERFLTMELVEGQSLAALLADKGALVGEALLPLAEPICAALAAAHAAGVVHRDLKPENILIGRDGRVVVTDFGIAHAHRDGGGTAFGGVVGTPAYMAPEQLQVGTRVDHRADLYALGAVLFEMVTGESAFRGDSLMGLLAMRANLTEPPSPRLRNPTVSAATAAVVMRCMAQSPADRFASAEEVAVALAAALSRAPTGPLAPNASGPAPSARAPEVPRPAVFSKTVAVVPLRNAGPPEDDYVADGLTDDLIDTLSMTRGLRVRPRGVVAQHKGRADARELGRELGVQVVAEGSVRRLGDSLRLSLRLIGTEDGFQLWAGRFDAPLNDLLVVTDQAARAMADALATELPSLERKAPTDPAAVELYLRARTEYWRTWHLSGVPSSALFERALALAPNDAKILAGCAMAHVRMVFFGEGDRAAVRERTRQLTARAVELAPDLGDAWAALAAFRLNDGDPVASAQALRDGLLRAPNSAHLQDLLGRLLLEVNAVDEGILRLGIAIELDPTLVSAYVDLSRGHALLGQWDKCDEFIDRPAGDLSLPVDTHRARMWLWRGTRTELPRGDPDTYLRVYSEVMSTGQLSPEQRARLQARLLGATSRLRPLFGQRNAEIFAHLGDFDAAIEAARCAIDAHLLDLAWIERCPTLEPLRSDPRWPPLREMVALRAGRILAALRGT